MGGVTDWLEENLPIPPLPPDPIEVIGWVGDVFGDISEGLLEQTIQLGTAPIIPLAGALTAIIPPVGEELPPEELLPEEPSLGSIVSPPAYTQPVLENIINTIDIIPLAFGKVKMRPNLVRLSSGMDTRKYIFSFCEGVINAYSTIYINDIDWNDIVPENLLVNADFEQRLGDSARTAKYWSSTNCGGADGILETASLQISSGGGQDGDHLILIPLPIQRRAAFITCQAFRTIEGDSYDTSCYVKAGGSGNGVPIELQILDGDTQETITSDIVNTDATWQQLSASFSALSSVSLMRLVLATPTTGSVFFDTANVRWTSEVRTKTEYTGTPSQTADTRFTSNPQAYRGIAYLAMTLDNDNQQITGNPNVTAVMETKKCAPIAGGADAFTRNPAVILWHIYTQIEGIAAADLNQAEFQNLETYCDAVPSGGTIARYRFDHVFDTRTPINDIKKLVWQSFHGCCIWSQGKIKPVWERDKTSAFAFTQDNMVAGSLRWEEPKRPNIIRINYINSVSSYKKDNVEELDETSITDNGEILYEESVLYITDEEIARRRCHFLYKKFKYPDYVCSLTGFPESSKVEVLDVVTVTHTLPGWTVKKFVVKGKSQDEHGRCTFKLEAYQKAFYNDETIDFQTDYSTSLPDPYEAPDHVTGVTLVEDAYINKDGRYVPTVTVTYARPTDLTFWNHVKISIRVKSDDALGVLTYYGDDYTKGTGYLIDGNKANFAVGDTVYVVVQSVNDNGITAPVANAPTDVRVMDPPAVEPLPVPSVPEPPPVPRPQLVKGLRIENKTTDYTWDGIHITVVWRMSGLSGGAGHEGAGREGAGAGGLGEDPYWKHDEVQIYIGGVLRHTVYTKELKYSYIYGDGQDDFLDNYVVANNGKITFKVFRWNTFNLRSEQPAVITVSNQNPATPIGIITFGSVVASEFSWTSASETDWDHYGVRIKVETDAWSSWSTIYDTTYTRFITQTELTDHGGSAEIFIEVKSVDVYGNESSVASNSQVLTTIVTVQITDDAITAPKIDVINLSAINADVGAITAGTLSSSDWAAAAGIRLDLANRWLKMGGSNVTAAGAAAGVFLGLDTSYKLYVGDGSNSFFKFDATSVTMSLDSVNALTIKGGGDINLEAGGDIILTPSDVNPALTKWGTTFNMGAGNSLRGLCIWPSAANTHDFQIGSSALGGSVRFDDIEIDAYNNIYIRSTFDGANRAEVRTVGGNNNSLLHLLVIGTNSPKLELDSQDGQCAFSNSFVTTEGGIHVGGTADPGADNLVVDGLISADGGQIAFPATAVPSADANTLDDYEEGYHAPVLVFCATSGDYTVSAGANNFSYTKIGRVVHVQGYIVVTGENAPNGGLRVSMPFAGAALTEDADRALGILVIVGHGDAGIERPFCFMGPGLAYVSLYESTDAGVLNAIDESRVDTAFTIYVDITYIAA